MMVSKKVLAILKARFADLPGQETHGDGWHAFDFAAPDGSAYSFRLGSSTDSQAELRAYPHPHADGVDLFWHMVMFRESYPTDGRFVEAAADMVANVLTRPTRIIQRKALLGWRFRCELYAGGQWSRLHEFVTWDRCCHPPSIVGREAIYTSKPVVKGSSDEQSV